VTAADRRERRPGLLDVGLDDGRDDVVLGLEVVVDVADRHVRRLRDVGQRRLLDAVAVEQLGSRRDQALPLPRCPLSRASRRPSPRRPSRIIQ
jgi:hypothetical protein